MPTGTLPLASLPNLALRTVELPDPLEFGRSPDEDLVQLRLLRDATSHAVRLRWRMAGRPVVPLHTHVHLVPPVEAVTPDGHDHASEWRAGYRYGAFYYRVGPGFVTVKDVRTDSEASRMVIDEGSDAFLRLAESPTGVPGPADQAAASAAVDAGLALRAGDRVLILPYRMRHWPVPYVAV